ncbi:hypothetical protein ACIO02_34185 [Streptomyces sp. NPDC087568]|uniref:hypothetical protein n=1 Tax=Streptomyces sp. NPDC087568 TaxID=3365799 RepID=UPI00380475F1
MSRALQQRLHGILQTATATLDLPLDPGHLERLAVEVTPAIKALLATAQATAEENAPIRCALTDAEVDEACGVRTTEYAGCVSRILVDVAEDSPAAVLAAELRGRQPDVIATAVPDATYLVLTLRPQSWRAWLWWLDKLGIPSEAVTRHGDTACAVGVVGTVAVEVCGEGVPNLLQPDVTPQVQRLKALLAGQREQVQAGGAL